MVMQLVTQSRLYFFCTREMLLRWRHGVKFEIRFETAFCIVFTFLCKAHEESKHNMAFIVWYSYTARAGSFLQTYCHNILSRIFSYFRKPSETSLIKLSKHQTFPSSVHFHAIPCEDRDSILILVQSHGRFEFYAKFGR